MSHSTQVGFTGDYSLPSFLISVIYLLMILRLMKLVTLVCFANWIDFCCSRRLICFVELTKILKYYWLICCLNLFVFAYLFVVWLFWDNLDYWIRSGLWKAEFLWLMVLMVIRAASCLLLNLKVLSRIFIIFRLTYS